MNTVGSVIHARPVEVVKFANTTSRDILARSVVEKGAVRMVNFAIVVAFVEEMADANTIAHDPNVAIAGGTSGANMTSSDDPVWTAPPLNVLIAGKRLCQATSNVTTKWSILLAKIAGYRAHPRSTTLNYAFPVGEARLARLPR